MYVDLLISISYTHEWLRADNNFIRNEYWWTKLSFLLLSTEWSIQSVNNSSLTAKSVSVVKLSPFADEHVDTAANNVTSLHSPYPTAWEINAKKERNITNVYPTFSFVYYNYCLAYRVETITAHCSDTTQ